MRRPRHRSNIGGSFKVCIGQSFDWKSHIAEVPPKIKGVDVLDADASSTNWIGNRKSV